MLEKLKQYGETYKEIIRYGVAGVATTVINIAVYKVCYDAVGISNVPSNIIAWILSVLFAFVTNKLWVFESRSLEFPLLLKETIAFFGCRLATGVLDLAIMYVTVDIMAWNSTLMKCISNVFVIVVNFVASKLMIFTKKK